MSRSPLQTAVRTLEAATRTSVHMRVDRETYMGDPADLLEFAKAYSHLGSSIQDQLEHLIDGDADWKNVNPNAVDVMRRELSGFNEQIDSVLENYEEDRSEA